MVNLGAAAAGAAAVAGIVRTLTDPEIVARVGRLTHDLRNRPRPDRASDLQRRAGVLSEQIAYLGSRADNDEERRAVADSTARLAGIVRSIGAADAASGRERRRRLADLDRKLDALTRDVIVRLVGEDEPAQAPRPKLGTTRGRRRLQR